MTVMLKVFWKSGAKSMHIWPIALTAAHLAGASARPDPTPAISRAKVRQRTMLRSAHGNPWIEGVMVMVFEGRG